jgi:hypothetical protein
MPIAAPTSMSGLSTIAMPVIVAWLSRAIWMHARVAAWLLRDPSRQRRMLLNMMLLLVPSRPFVLRANPGESNRACHGIPLPSERVRTPLRQKYCRTQKGSRSKLQTARGGMSAQTGVVKRCEKSEDSTSTSNVRGLINSKGEFPVRGLVLPCVSALSRALGRANRQDHGTRDRHFRQGHWARVAGDRTLNTS